MLDDEQFLLCKLAEEADEVGQRAMKMMQYGRDEAQPGQPYTNGERLRGELLDLMAVARLAADAGLFPHIASHEIGQHTYDKGEKIARYRRLAERLGRVSSATGQTSATGSALNADRRQATEPAS